MLVADVSFAVLVLGWSLAASPSGEEPSEQGCELSVGGRLFEAFKPAGPVAEMVQPVCLAQASQHGFSIELGDGRHLRALSMGFRGLQEYTRVYLMGHQTCIKKEGSPGFFRQIPVVVEVQQRFLYNPPKKIDERFEVTGHLMCSGEKMFLGVEVPGIMHGVFTILPLGSRG